MEKTLLGFKRFRSKKGNPVCIIFLSRKYTENENGNDCYGCEVEQLFVPSEQYDYLVPSDIGRPVHVQYEIFNGRAHLVRVTVDRK